MDPINIFLASIILINLLLIAAASLGGNNRSDSSSVRAAYLVHIVTIIWWLASTIFFRIADASNIFFYTKNLYVSATLIAGSFSYFSHIFPKPRQVPMRTHAAIVAATLTLIGFIVFTQGIIQGGIVHARGENAAILGQYFPIYALYILYYFCTGFRRIFLKYASETEMATKRQLLLVFFGYTISGGVAFVADLLLPIIGIFSYVWIGPAATIFVALCLTYAVKRYGFLSGRIVAAELVICALWIVAFVRVTFFTEVPDPSVDMFYLLATIIVGGLLMRSLRRESEQRERNESLVSELVAANAKLKEIDEQKTKFVSLATHHMASPLTAMKAYVDFLKEGGDPSLVTDGGLEKAADNFMSVVRDFLDISKIERGDVPYALDAVDLAEVADLSCRACERAAASRGISLSIDEVHDINAPIRGDKVRLCRSLCSILENCIKYSKPGERVSISIRNICDGASILVSDSAVRSVPAVAAALVAKFSPVANKTEADIIGSSIGLYAAKQTIEGHGGSFRIRYDEAERRYSFNIEMKAA